MSNLHIHSSAINNGLPNTFRAKNTILLIRTCSDWLSAVEYPSRRGEVFNVAISFLTHRHILHTINKKPLRITLLIMFENIFPIHILCGFKRKTIKMTCDV